MSIISCFPPIARSDAQLLILGSMPGKESLRTQQYYAHPRNVFWKIMGELVGTFPALSYETRSRILESAGIAVWDVLASCERGSSLDADIVPGTISANDFNAFFASHPHITRVFFNGHMAEKCFGKHVRPWLATMSLHYLRLPSTSPAHASISFEMKLQAWEALINSNALRDFGVAALLPDAHGED